MAGGFPSAPPHAKTGDVISHIPGSFCLEFVEPRLFYLAVTVTPAVSNQLLSLPLKARTV